MIRTKVFIASKLRTNFIFIDFYILCDRLVYIKRDVPKAMT